jgi:hypothetical protein
MSKNEHHDSNKEKKILINVRLRKKSRPEIVEKINKKLQESPEYCDYEVDSINNATDLSYPETKDGVCYDPQTNQIVQC